MFQAPLERFTRREALSRVGGGFGALALAELLTERGLTANAAASSTPLAGSQRHTNQETEPRPHLNGGLHHRAKARRVIQLFMNGGASPMDLFDYKPALEKLHGQRFDPGTGEMVESVTSSPGFKVMKTPFRFARHGECGRWVSELLPHTARFVDDIAFLMSMTSKTNVHGPASYMQCTGFTLPGFPSMGSWISYGLGRITDNLPTFVVLPDPRGLPYNNQGNFTSGFLPVVHQGTIIKPHAAEPIADLHPPKDAKYITGASEAEGLALLAQMNRRHLDQWPGDDRLEARIASYEMAAKMQTAAPEVMDLARETAATRRLYGMEDKRSEAFGRSCLTARRMIEHGVRFVQVWSGAAGPSNNWDNHGDIPKELPPIAAQTDQPIAGLLADLKARGLWEDTLVIWTTEFGRMPFSQGSAGRDHNGGTFVSWIAGAGVKGGAAYGESDPWAWRSLTPTYCYDLHATILHLLGIDHTRLTLRHNGIDRRLTDVHGHVIESVLA